MAQIDKDIPIPKASNAKRKDIDIPNIEEMEIGDSFVVEIGEYNKDRLRMILLSRVKKYEFKPATRFVTENEKKCIRVWRVA